MGSGLSCALGTPSRRPFRCPADLKYVAERMVHANLRIVRWVEEFDTGRGLSSEDTVPVLRRFKFCVLCVTVPVSRKLHSFYLISRELCI